MYAQQISAFFCRLMLLTAYLLSFAGWAHGGAEHSHAGDATDAPLSQASGEQARRLADGSVYVPKAVQFLWQLQTGPAIRGDWPQFLQLPATVVLDPASTGLVEAAQLGRLSAGPAGYPSVGQQVKAGQVLAYLEPQDSTLDRSNQQALLAELKAQISLTRDRIKRLSKLGSLIAQSELDNARIELAGLEQRFAFANKATGQLLPIIAPVSGTLSQVYKQAGQYVQAQEALFLLLEPQSLLVEALSYTSADQQQLLKLMPGAAASAQSLDGQQQWPLTFSGSAGALRQQALPLYFRADLPATPLLLGQVLQVQVALPLRQRGILLPAAAVQRRENGDSVVWLKTSAEQFRQQQVVVQTASAGLVLVTAGLAEQQLVVLSGAGWLMQVR